MKVIERIKAWMTSQALKRECEVVSKEVFDYKVVGEYVYILCHNRAIRRMSTSDTLQDIHKEIKNLVEIAKEYEVKHYESNRI